MSESSAPFGVDIDETIGGWLRSRADRFGDRPLFDIVGVARSAAHIWTGAAEVAAGLAGLGLSTGDRVAVMMVNSAANLDAWLGACTAGLVEVPINTAQRGDLLRYLLAQSGSRAVIVDSALADRVARVAADLPALRHVIVHDADTAVDLDLPARISRHSLDGVRRSGPVPEPDINSLSTSTVLYTSGTTGPSKGVVLSHSANLYLARHTAHLMGYGPADVLYTAFPLFHINAKYTSTLAALEVGARLVMDAASARRGSGTRAAGTASPPSTTRGRCC